MKTPVFITGNPNKAVYLSRYLGFELQHQAIDLVEIQSLDLKKVVADKARRAYDQVEKPVLVEDVSLEFTALGRLPGTFIKFFMEEMSLEQLCRLVDGKDRSARAACVFAYYDGQIMRLFEGGMTGAVADKPRGDGGYGWDKIIVPDGYEQTRAELSETDNQKTYKQIKPLDEVKRFLEA